MFLFLKFLLVQSNFWNIEDYQIDSQFLKIFCESVQFSKYESDEEYFLNIFSEGIYKIDSNFNYSSIGIWPNYICDPLFSQENYIEIYENTARFDFPEKTLSLGFQKGSFLSINSENIPILIKTSSNFLILEKSIENIRTLNYTITIGETLSKDWYYVVYSNLVICNYCNFLLNMHTGSSISLRTENQNFATEVSVILDTNVFVIFPVVEEKNIEEILIIEYANLLFKRLGYAEVYGSVIYFDGVIEKGDFVIIDQKEDDIYIEFWDKNIKEVVFSSMGLIVVENPILLPEQTDTKQSIFIMQKTPEEKACPTTVLFTKTNMYDEYKTKCTNLQSQNFIINFEIKFVENMISSLFINFQSEKKSLFRVLLGPITYIFSYTDYSVKSYDTSSMLSLTQKNEIFLSVHGPYLYISTDDLLANLEIKYFHSDLSKITSFSLQSMEDCIVSKISSMSMSNQILSIFGTLENIEAHSLVNGFTIELEDGDPCGSGFYKSFVEILCGRKFQIREIKKINDCYYHVYISAPVICSENTKEYFLLQPTYLIDFGHSY